MKKSIILIFSIVLFVVFCSPVFSASGKYDKNKSKYQVYKGDKVLKEMSQQSKEARKKKAAVTSEIRARQSEEKKARRESRRVLVTDLAGVYPPKSVKDFKQYFHFSPVAQYMTSTCWSFATTSFFESEVYRLKGEKIKLSEIWAPYWELLEKCRRYIDERGNSYVAGGAQSESVIRMWKQHGIVPAEVYPGVLDKEGKHDHSALMKEVGSYLSYIKENNLWDEEDNLKHITMILNKHLGEPPKSFTYNGKTMTPREFLQNETGLNLDDYYALISTSYFPFYTKAEFRAPDNWWHSENYINLPLDVWYSVIQKTIKSGITIVIGGDVSEPGKMGMHDLAFVPTFDIPAAYINQDSREFRINNRTTGDDHAIHMVGYTKVKGKDWYLMKDSGRSARHGKHEGYYFFRGDFIRLKMLSFVAHKDMLKDILPKIKEEKK